MESDKEREEDAHPLFRRSGSFIIVIITIRDLSSVFVPPFCAFSTQAPPIKKKAWRQSKGTGGNGHVCFFCLQKNKTKGSVLLDASHVTHRVKDEGVGLLLVMAYCNTLVQWICACTWKYLLVWHADMQGR